MQVCPSLGHFVSLRELLPDAQIAGADDIAMKRRLAGWSVDFLTQVLTGKIT